jgi:hypothetical protein
LPEVNALAYSDLPDIACNKVFEDDHLIVLIVGKVITSISDLLSLRDRINSPPAKIRNKLSRFENVSVKGSLRRSSKRFFVTAVIYSRKLFIKFASALFFLSCDKNKERKKNIIPHRL